MSNGDSPDGFVFPPFIPPAAATRPVDPPAPAPAPPSTSDEPSGAVQAAAPGRMSMPWDVETPIVSSPADVPPSAPATEDAEEEDLPWLERPAPREPVAEAPAAEPAAGTDEAFPDWLAWDDRDTDDARSESQGVAPVEGLQDFAPVDDPGGFVAPEPAVDWAEAAPPVSAVENAAPEAVDSSDWSLDAPDAAEPPVLAGAAPEMVDSSDWSLDAPEAAEPPVVADATPEVTFETPAAADIGEPTFEVTLEDGAITFAPAGEADEAAPEPLADDAEPAAAVDAHPFVADAEAVLSAEPNPFTAAVHEAETDTLVDAVPAASAAGTAPNGVFGEVAVRLEDIARTLRERPDELLSGAASDPLALLVAGYVMGYNARR